MMTGKEAVRLSGRSETWLRNHSCAWCGQTLWRALRHGCGAVGERCNPAVKDFTASGGSLTLATALRTTPPADGNRT